MYQKQFYTKHAGNVNVAETEKGVYSFEFLDPGMSVHNFTFYEGYVDSSRPTDEAKFTFAQAHALVYFNQLQAMDGR